jgi:hypothetical protein
MILRNGRERAGVIAALSILTLFAASYGAIATKPAASASPASPASQPSLADPSMPPVPAMKPLKKLGPRPQFLLDLTASPNVSGLKLTDCKPIALGEDGTAAIIATYAGDKTSPQGGSALLLGQGPLRIVMRSGMAAAGFSGDKVDKILADSLSLSDTGQPLFMTTLSHDKGKEAQDRQLWFAAGMSPTLVAAEGRSLAKGTEVTKKIQAASLMRNGLIILHLLEGTNEKPTRYIGTTKKFTVIAFPGEDGSKADASAKEFDEPELHGMLPYAALVGSADGAQSIWIGWEGKFKRVAATGDPAPGMDGFTFKSFVGEVGAEFKSINGVGQVAFVATAVKDATERAGVWATRGGALQLITSAGEVLPGPVTTETLQATLTKPLDAFIDDDGDVFAFSSMKIKEQELHGVHMWRDGQPTFVMADTYSLTGQQPPANVSFTFNRSGMHVETVKVEVQDFFKRQKIMADEAVVFEPKNGWTHVLTAGMQTAFEEGSVVRAVGEIKWLSPPTSQGRFLCRGTLAHSIPNRFEPVMHDRLFLFSHSGEGEAKARQKMQSPATARATAPARPAN